MSVSSTKTGLGLRRFFRDKRGGVAVIFALAFTPVAFLSLVMIDFSRASTARTNLQETLDAATLLAARSTAITAADIQTVGGNAFSSQVATNLGIKVNTDTFVTGANNHHWPAIPRPRCRLWSPACSSVGPSRSPPTPKWCAR